MLYRPGWYNFTDMAGKRNTQSSVIPDRGTEGAEEVSVQNADVRDVDLIATIIGFFLIILNIAWLAVIAPAIFNTLFARP